MNSTRKRNLATLRELKEIARQRAWELKRAGYIVVFSNRYRKGYIALKVSEIYDYEKVHVYELQDDKWVKIISDGNYSDLAHFHEVVKERIKKHGKKKLHQYTQEILDEEKNRMIKFTFNHGE